MVSSKTPRGVDMSPEAIDRRLRTVSELYQFATTVKHVKWLGKAKDLEVEAEGAAGDRDEPHQRPGGGQSIR